MRHILCELFNTAAETQHRTFVSSSTKAGYQSELSVVAGDSCLTPIAEVRRTTREKKRTVAYGVCPSSSLPLIVRAAFVILEIQATNLREYIICCSLNIDKRIRQIRDEQRNTMSSYTHACAVVCRFNIGWDT